MTVYTVVWDDQAIDELTRLWTEAEDREAVRAAADSIDAILRHDPDKKGLPFHTRRCLAVLPLVITFAVFPEDRLAKVLQVWRDPTISLN